jgi:hypothetical protein
MWPVFRLLPNFFIDPKSLVMVYSLLSLTAFDRLLGDRA